MITVWVDLMHAFGVPSQKLTIFDKMDCEHKFLMRTAYHLAMVSISPLK